MPEKTNAVGGALRTPPDYRQVTLEHISGAAPAPTLTSIHIDDSKLPDFFQRTIGACQNHAYAEILTHREQRLNPNTTFVASPRFTYTMSKIEDGVGIENQGTYAVQPFKEGVKYGCCSEATLANDTTLPYLAYIFNGSVQGVPQACFTEADLHRIPGYVQVGSEDNVTAAQLVQALQDPDGQDGIAIMMALGAEWYTDANGNGSWAKGKIIPIRKVVTAIDDHIVRCNGIEQEAGTGRWKVFFRNHWSKNWASTSGIEGGTQPQDLDGDIGWFYLDQHVIVEAWIVREIPDALLAIIKSLPNQKDFSHVWSTNLNVGATGADVQALQIALKIAGTFPFNQPVTTYYGQITATAVMAFQTKYAVASAASILAAGGNMGEMTRAALNKMFSHQ